MFTWSMRCTGTIASTQRLSPLVAVATATHGAGWSTMFAVAHHFALRHRALNVATSPISQRNGTIARSNGSAGAALGSGHHTIGGGRNASGGRLHVAHASVSSNRAGLSSPPHATTGGVGGGGSSSGSAGGTGSGSGGNGTVCGGSSGVNALKRKKKKALKEAATLKKRRVKACTAAAQAQTAQASASTVANTAAITALTTTRGGVHTTSATTLSSASSSHSSHGAAGNGSGGVNASSPAAVENALRPRLKRKSIDMKKKKTQKIRVCVLNSSYKGADSVTAKFDNFHCSPAHWVKKDRKRYTFTEVTVQKNDSYRLVRELVTSNKFDVFFNLCDAGKDEKRAGVDVVEALEEHNAAFTGTDSRSFEPSKIDMKFLVGAAGVKTPNFVLLDSVDGLAKKCRHLRFPVIVKHLSGYASVGIHKDNRCDTLDELKVKVPAFLREFNHALVEEFIRGREGTVLTCADSSSLLGVKVFKPLMFKFLQNDDDFAYFEKKWSMECNDSAYGFLPHNDPAYPLIVDMARNAFQHVMNGVGYGRVDFRIDSKGDVYFLEINPNCGMWYSEKDGGDFADLMVQGDKSWDHDRFVRNAVLRAMREQVARRPWYFISHDSKGNFSTRARKTVRAGKSLFNDAMHPVPVIAQALYKLGEEDPTVGCVILRGDRLHQAVAIRHSCEPNMHFMQGRTLTLVAKRKINVGEELTVDYATLCDERMPPFACSCGTSNCRSVIFPSSPTPRTLEGKNMRQVLREKKRAWYKKKEDREAERMLKKRASRGRCGTGASPPSGTAAAASPSAHAGSSGTISVVGSHNSGGGGGQTVSDGSATKSINTSRK